MTTEMPINPLEALNRISHALLEGSQALNQTQLQAAANYWMDMTRVCNATPAGMRGPWPSDAKLALPFSMPMFTFRPEPFAGPFALPFLQWNPLAGWVMGNPPPLP